MQKFEQDVDIHPWIHGHGRSYDICINIFLFITLSLI